MKLYSERAGTLYHMQSNYDCFLPRKLNEINIHFDKEMELLLGEANNLIGRLDGIAMNLPDKDVYISKYLEKEALLSSQIEGTQASLNDVLQYKKIDERKRKKTVEIVNYINALNYGIKLLEKLPISIRFLRELHKILLNNVRGNDKDPGEIRKTQNWIGQKDCNLNNAIFIPPSVDLMKQSLNELELYINDETIQVSPLIKISLIHYQFETIHPFLDGNGRLGRLIIPLWLKSINCLKYPLLYLSLYFKQNRTEYYSLLMDVRFKGKYEEWIKFFLKGIIEMSKNSIDTINKIKNLIDSIDKKISNLKQKNTNTIKLAVSYMYKHPYFDTKDLKEELSLSKPTISKIIKDLLKLDIIKPTSDKQRYVTYKLYEYISILEEGTEI